MVHPSEHVTSTPVRTDLYPHMPILRPHAARYSTNGVEPQTGTFTSRAGRFVRFWTFGGANFPQKGDSLP